MKSYPRLSLELSTELCSNGFVSDEKQALHMKFVKLVSLLEEVENRFERYYNQMQEVVSSFEAVAGAGSVRYPTESEKLFYLHRQASVSNWFINARLRLWKPVIEEMYKEECADSSDSDPLGTSGMTGEGRMVLYEE